MADEGRGQKVTGRVDVAMIQSLVRKGSVSDLVAGYGHVVIDECHAYRGVFGFHVAHASSLIVRAIETEGPPGRDRAKNRAIQPRQVHDPGIQEEPLPAERSPFHAP